MIIQLRNIAKNPRECQYASSQFDARTSEIFAKSIIKSNRLNKILLSSSFATPTSGEDNNHGSLTKWQSSVCARPESAGYQDFFWWLLRN